MWSAADLETESDVEQKFLFPLLTEPKPLGLGLPATVILTKTNIRSLPIGKGSSKKIYYPDYLISILGLPVLIVEAKRPGESIDEGFREARMYAAEINALFEHGIAPARFVIASDGIEIWYGYGDQSEPVGQEKCSGLGVYSPAIADIVGLMSWESLRRWAGQIAETMRPVEHTKPRRLLGGLGIQNEEVGINTFGASLTSTISPIFNPTSQSERAAVARHAYISSKRRERYVDPIDRVIRAARAPSQSQSQTLEDSENPKEVIGKLRQLRELENKVMLLVGSVGSGKTTFVDHLLEVALPRELMEATVWCRINMNAAPVTPSEIYRWLRQEIVQAQWSCPASVDRLSS